MSGALQALIPNQPSPVVNMGVDKNVASVGGGGTGAGTAKLFANGNWTGVASPGGTGGFSSTWVLPTIYAGAAYEARSTITAGTLDTDPSAGAWISLSTDRTWSKILGGSGTFTLEIRDVATSTVRDTCIVTLSGS